MISQSCSREAVPGEMEHVQHVFKGKFIAVMAMSIYPPLLFFFQLWVGNYTSISEWGLSWLLNAVLTLSLFLILRCYISSIYLRLMVFFPFLVVTAVSLIKMNGLPFWPSLVASWPGLLVNLVLLCYFVRFSARRLWGMRLVMHSRMHRESNNGYR
jgi:hypothetical protein